MQTLHLLGLNHYTSESPGAFFGITADKGLSCNPVQECKDYDNITFVSCFFFCTCLSFS